MPKLVSTMTPMRSGRFGPKKLTNGPAISLPSAGMSDSLVRASVKPPLFTSTATMTATMPSSMTMPWMKSFITVAM